MCGIYNECMYMHREAYRQTDRHTERNRELCCIRHKLSTYQKPHKRRAITEQSPLLGWLLGWHAWSEGLLPL